MLPPDFAAGEPRLFDLPAEWQDLKDRYACLGPSRTLDWVYSHVEDQQATGALLEHEYIDSDYRDEYAHFYVTTFRSLPDRCERLHFWSGERYIGYCSIRPVAGQPVCRTMLEPGPELQEDVSCVVQATAHPYGRSLSVPAFPFISQDHQYGRCAHAVLWMIANYHHLVNDTPACTMSDIVTAAAEEEPERIVPSRGMTEAQVGGTLRRLGLSAVKYRVRDHGEAAVDAERELLPGDVHELVRRYLNSRMPLVLGTPGHLTAIIGACRDGSSLRVVRCDDERGAYCPQRIDLAKTSKERWTTLFVPLPGRIYALGEQILPRAVSELEDLAALPECERRALSARKLRTREYVVDSRDYKADVQLRALPGSTAASHLQVPCPRWIWVVEAQDAKLADEGKPCTVGEIAIDATSSGEDPHFLFANVPGLRAVWRQNDPTPAVRPVTAAFAPYLSGTALNL